MLVRHAARRASLNSCAIAVMAKASQPGRTKTRLAPPLTPDLAAGLNTVFLRDIAENLAAASQQADIAAYVAYGPPGSTAFFERHLPPAVGLLEAWLPNFGDCLFQTADTLLALGHGAACVLNSDSPTLPTAVLVEAARTLAAPGDRIVLGPSTDGGYYLLGIKQPHRRLFEDVTWSSAAVLQQTRERAAELKLETVMLPTWYDVDDATSLERLMGETLHGRAFSSAHRSHAAAHTAELLRRVAGEGLLPALDPTPAPA